MNVRVVREEAGPAVARARVSRPSGAPRTSEGARNNRRTSVPDTNDSDLARASAPSTPPRPPLRERLSSFGTRLREACGRAWARAVGPLRALFRVAVAAGLVAASVAIVRFIDRYARTSPEFAIETLAISGNERVPSDELEETMGIAIGDNVFARSPEEVRASLEEHPWIASATVRRRLPRTFEVEVRERTPALLLVLEQPYLVDEDATVFKAFEEGDPVDLPVITGVDPERFERDRGYRTELLTASIALVSEWETANLARREPIAEIHVEPDEGLTLFIGDDGTEVRLGRGPYRGKLGRLRRVLDELGRRQSRPLYVYLDNVRRPDRVTVRVR